jgi:non-ribosomal peptide synthetase component F
MCADPESVNNLVRQIAAAYEASVHHRGGDNRLPQFADIAEWQREELANDQGEPGRLFWKQQAAGLAGPPLPLEKAPDAAEPFAPRFCIRTLDAGSWSELRRRAAESGTHPQAWLLACWKILIARLTRDTSVLVQWYSDGRTLEELTEVVGPLGRYLPLRTMIDTNATLGRTARGVHDLLELGRQWHHAFGGPADAAPLIGTGFDYFEPQSATGPGDVALSVESASVFLEPFGLRLSCSARPDDLRITLHYDGRRFQEADIQRLAGQFEVLFRQAAAAPDTPVGKLNVLTDSERQSLLVEFNDTAADYPRQSCIHHFIEEQARQTPEKVAVIAGNQQLDYLALNGRANQLARYLQSCGVGPNVLVGICLERSIEMIVSILGDQRAAHRSSAIRWLASGLPGSGRGHH